MAITSLLVVLAIASSLQQVAYGQITSPAEYSNLTAGANQEITWKVKGDSACIVLLQYSTDAGLSWNYIATTGIAAGSYIWVIPVGISSYFCRVRIAKFTGAGYVQVASTGNFSIEMLNPTSGINAVFSHRVIVLLDNSKQHVGRTRFFK